MKASFYILQSKIFTYAIRILVGVLGIVLCFSSCDQQGVLTEEKLPSIERSSKNTIEVSNLEVYVPEMMSFPSITTINISLEFSESDSIDLKAKRINDVTFVCEPFEIIKGTSIVDQITCVVDQDAQVQKRFSNIVFSFEGSREINTTNLSVDRKLSLYSLTYDSPPKISELSNGEKYHLKSGFDEDCFFFMFVNRCNVTGSADSYHQVLRYDIRFSDMIPLASSSTDGFSNVFKNYIEGSIQDQPYPLLIVGPLTDVAPVLTLPNADGEGGDVVGIEITPMDLSSGQAITGDALYTQISAKQWNDHLAGFCLLLCACSQQEELGEKFQEPTVVAVDLQLNKADIQQNKAGGLDDIDFEYCLDGLPEEGKITVTYSGVFSSSEDPTIDYSKDNFTDDQKTYDFKIQSFDGDNAFLTDLVMFTFPDKADKLTLTVTDFRVYANDGTTLLFLSPQSGSAYADYVETPVEQVFEIDIYEKQYIEMDVLCFQKEDIPLFGFSWFDFNIVKGDEVCLFFNCLGNTAATYHQVFAGEFKVLWNDVEPAATSDNWVEYWTGMNYTEAGVPADIEPFCIPCPGNWETEGMKVEVYPAWSPLISFQIELTPEMILGFLNDDADIFDDGGLPTGALFAQNGVNLESVNGVPFIHITLADCYKPAAFYTDFMATDDNVGSTLGSLTDGTSNVFALNYDVSSSGTMSDFSAAYAFSVDGACHLAMTPDQSKLIIVTPDAGNVAGYANNDATYVSMKTGFSYFDIYSLKRTYLKPTNTKDLKMPDGTDIPDEYDYSELLYVDGMLFAACNGNNCLTRIDVDFVNNTFTFGPDFVDMPAGIDYAGGDLVSVGDKSLISIASMSSGVPGIIRFTINESAQSLVTEAEYSVAGNPIGITHLTGASTVTSGNDIKGILAATNNKGGNSGFYYFNPTDKEPTSITLTEGTNIFFGKSNMALGSSFMKWGGDLASPVNSLMSGGTDWTTFEAFFPTLTEI